MTTTPEQDQDNPHYYLLRQTLHICRTCHSTWTSSAITTRYGFQLQQSPRDARLPPELIRGTFYDLFPLPICHNCIGLTLPLENPRPLPRELEKSDGSTSFYTINDVIDCYTASFTSPPPTSTESP